MNEQCVSAFQFCENLLSRVRKRPARDRAELVALADKKLQEDAGRETEQFLLKYKRTKHGYDPAYMDFITVIGKNQDLLSSRASLIIN